MNLINIIVPDLPESVVNATVISWKKNIGEFIKRDSVIVEIETDKVVLEVSSPDSGYIKEILVNAGSSVKSKQILCYFSVKNNIIKKENFVSEKKNEIYLSPSFRFYLFKFNLCIQEFNFINIKKNNINKNDLNKLVKKNIDKRILMSNLRKRISERLLEVKKNTVMLTTFNEVNMKKIIELRNNYNVLFEKKFNVKLGFMSFYVKSVIEALKSYPIINSYIDGDEIVYFNNFDISIAVSTSRGLITPVLKDVDKMSFFDIERKIKELSFKGRENKLNVEDLIGGNFTITNGGVFGSLMSTPIINPPQSAILGIHVIKDRPIVSNNEIIISPMMYLALTYDHRLIDGKESVGFLIKIKEILEDPIRLLLDI